MQLKPGLHRFTRGVSNYYVLEEGGKLVLVDAGVTGDWGPLLRWVTSAGYTPRDLSAILLTHAHADHTGFAERARTSAGAGVWAHQEDVPVAQGRRAGRNEGGFGRYLRHVEAWRTLFGLLAHGGTKVVPVLKVAGFSDGQTVPVASPLRAVHIPGHTPGMAALYSPGHRAVFTGDGLVTRNPLTGRRGPQIMPRALNQNSRQALESLTRLLDLDANLLLPGHGEPWNQEIAHAVADARTAGES